MATTTIIHEPKIIRSVDDVQLANLQQLGDTVAISYSCAEDSPTNGRTASVTAAIVGKGGNSYIVEDDTEGGTEAFLEALGDRRRIYHDAITARSFEASQMLPLATKFDDIAVMAHLLDENLHTDLEHLPERFLSDLSRQPQTYPSEPLAKASLIQTLWDKGRLHEKIERQGLGFAYRKIELPVIDPTILIMNNGICVDMPTLEWRHREYATKVKRLKKSTAAETGEADAHNNANVKLKRLQNLHRCTSSLLRYLDRDTGRIHCTLDPLGTKTGRFSCYEPNLQGLPAELRGLLVAEAGCQLIQADYSQLELRILTHYSREPKLLAAYNSEKADIHRHTAGIVLGKGEKTISKAEREIGKRVNFGIIYGLTPAGLASQLGINTTQAEDLIEGFMQGYPRVREWIQRVERAAIERGYVKTLYGRRRRLPELGSSASGQGGRALRQAVNAVIQGTAADIMKMAIIRLYERLPPDCRMLLTVHDSVLVEAPAKQTKIIKQILREAMEEQPPKFDVALTVDIGSGTTWAGCQEA